MTASDFCLFEIETVGRQLEQAVDGLSAEHWEVKGDASSMSPREMFAHLAECYVAAQMHFTGEEYAWGTYQVPDSTVAGVMAAYHEEREKAVSLLRDNPSLSALKDASSYIILHDAYHVGQLCALRMSLDPEWNAYAIYE